MIYFRITVNAASIKSIRFPIHVHNRKVAPWLGPEIGSTGEDLTHDAVDSRAGLNEKNEPWKAGYSGREAPIFSSSKGCLYLLSEPPNFPIGIY
jgi:hypothetical protein